MPSESVIWQIDLFRKIGNEQAECNECKTKLKITKGSTSVLINHLKAKHKNSEYSTKYVHAYEMKYTSVKT
jgi:hypothetical protein